MTGCTANHSVVFINWIVVLLLKTLRREGDVWLRHLALIYWTSFPWHCRQRWERIARFRELAAKSVVHREAVILNGLGWREMGRENPVRFRSLS